MAELSTKSCPLVRIPIQAFAPARRPSPPPSKKQRDYAGGLKQEIEQVTASDPHKSSNRFADLFGLITMARLFYTVTWM
jgi:hypothetical protein